MNVAPELILIGALVTAVGALLQGTVGLGFALFAVPVMTLFDGSLVPVPQLLLAIPLAISIAWRERHAMSLRRVAWILAGRPLGVVVGLGLLSLEAPQRVLDGVIGALVLGMAGLMASSIRIPRGRGADFVVGALASVSGTMASISGPPLALLFRGATGPELRANLALLFTVGLAMTLTGRAASGFVSPQDLLLALIWLPALALGFWGSRLVIPRVEGAPLRRAVVAACALAGLAVMLRAFFEG
ncbi:MAG: sulfite exporter TauE/SafE family protein [Myxococcota bacterium]